MKLERIEAGRLAVQGLGPDGYRVAGAVHPGGVVIGPEGARGWDAEAADAIGPDALPPGDYDLLVVGTGPTLRRAPPGLLEAAASRGVAVEAMDSRSAARTFNMLLAEGRRVAAALLPL